MTSNYSLELSLQLRNLIREDLLKNMMDEFPFEKVRQMERGENKRDRVYNSENTLLTMLMTSFMEDKSLQNSVNIFQGIFEARSKELIELQIKNLEQEVKRLPEEKKRGRPKSFKPRIAKSKQTGVSQNTAAYSKARQRLNIELVEEVFNFSKVFPVESQIKWQGMITYLLDGCYFQMQDTPALRKKYYVRENDGAYPQGLLEALICQGVGYISDFRIGTRHQSELELAFKMLDSLPGNSL